MAISVIQPKPYRERTKRTDYPRKENLRDVLCQDIDAVLNKRPASFEEFLQLMKVEGYEIKQGKHISFRGKNQKRFIRLSSLGDDHSETGLRAVIAGGATHQGKEKAATGKPQREVSLIIDIQSKLQEKGAGYKRWATVYNLKQMSKTLLFLRDHGIESMDQLNTLVTDKVSRKEALLSSIQTSEKRLAEIAALKKHIINYSKTRTAYEAYRKSGYSKKFLEEHREEITLHKAAKAAFDELGVKRLPKVKDLTMQYAETLSEKKKDYTEYRLLKNEVQELLIAQRNIASLYDAEHMTNEQEHRQEEQR